MADKDYSQLTSTSTVADTDLFAVYPTGGGGGPLKKISWTNLKTAIAAAVSGSYLTIASNLSDLASASVARANLGLGTAATLAAGAIFQVANNLSEIANAAQARANIGAAASASPTITGGMTFSGSTKQNVQALGALDFDLSATEFFTKAISANSVFTFSNATASKAQVFIVELTITSSAVPTWPASVDWAGGVAPTLGNGKHILGFVTFDGGTNWVGIVGALATA